MRLTNYSDYALRTLIYLAVVPDKHELATISDVADSYQISKSHLTKVIHQLAQLGYIESIRGKNGGIRLAKAPENINLGEVICHTEPDFAIVPCFDSQNTSDEALTKSDCRITPVCKLKPIFWEATQAFIAVLTSHTLADIISNDISLQSKLG
ncbi:Rrf2 family transcriptional regulator [Psychrobacter sp. I-STPA6b]|uniref:Rrf2 family transcriptional regulator n=1 Tax=Psychrobacter sp. I-STPA6b TaxID=2585718 RepID=UPI001D0C0192|nr:Rrf2 family transcriptional regulator [Psychrobacter sp. I-STPA6b]